MMCREQSKNMQNFDSFQIHCVVVVSQIFSELTKKACAQKYHYFVLLIVLFLKKCVDTSHIFVHLIVLFYWFKNSFKTQEFSGTFL